MPGGEGWIGHGLEAYKMRREDAAWGKKASWVYDYMVPLKKGAAYANGTLLENGKGDCGKLCTLCFDVRAAKVVFYGDTGAMGDHLERGCASCRSIRSVCLIFVVWRETCYRVPALLRYHRIELPRDYPSVSS